MIAITDYDRLESYAPPVITIVIGFYLFTRADAYLMDYATQLYGRKEAVAWSMLWLPILGELFLFVMAPIGYLVYGTADIIFDNKENSGDNR